MASLDLAFAVAVFGLFVTAMIAFGVASLVWGRPRHARLARELGLPIVGKGPMEAVYGAVLPVGRALVAMGVGANAVTVASLFVAVGAAVLFGYGHFGAGAAVAIAAALMDAVDGMIARDTGTTSRFGQVLDTTVDRLVEALLFGGIAMFVRQEPWLLGLALAALTGGFMVSYASSVLREIGAEDANAPMRRAHRMTYLLLGALGVPVAAAVLPAGFALAPLILTLGAIAVIGNVSAVSRLLGAARVASRPAPSARVGRSGGGIDRAVANERHP